jgi:hypothetical protein
VSPAEGRVDNNFYHKLSCSLKNTHLTFDLRTSHLRILATTNRANSHIFFSFRTLFSLQRRTGLRPRAQRLLCYKQTRRNTCFCAYTGKPRCMRFRSMRFSVNTVTNIYTIPVYVPPKISNSASDYETKNF